jgi:hypothetical protein
MLVFVGFFNVIHCPETNMMRVNHQVVFHHSIRISRWMMMDDESKELNA